MPPMETSTKAAKFSAKLPVKLANAVLLNTQAAHTTDECFCLSGLHIK